MPGRRPKTPVLCAACHASEALPGTGLSGIPPLTQSVHALHAHATDPTNGLTLESSSNRSACYRCHPGSTTRCLRGAMGSAVAADGSMAMQCQSCHGSMSQVGGIYRRGWLDEPNCQACHTGTAVQNSGQIRYTSAFTSSGQFRVPANTTFATNPNTPGTGMSLFRFSQGTRRAGLFRVPRINSRRIPQFASQRQPAEPSAAGTRRCDVGLHHLSQRRPKARSQAARTGCIRLGRGGPEVTVTQPRATRDSARLATARIIAVQSVPLAWKPYDVDRFWNPDVLARFPDRLLYVPQRAGQ